MHPAQDKQEKEFIFRHSRTVFELLDEDGSNDISAEEFESFGFLFNFQGSAVRQIFREFDVSGDQVCAIIINETVTMSPVAA
jgi:Ca2+-binding EF-hand superfamily protein